MNNLDKETNFLIKLTEDLYRKTLLPDLDIKEINIDKFIDIALKNNLLCYVAKKILLNYSLAPALKRRFDLISQRCELEFQEVKRSIDEVKTHIQDHRIFKTYRGDDFPRVGNDVDVLVRDLNSVKDHFITMGYRTKNDSLKEKSVDLLKDGQKKIHLQGAITWCWAEYLDSKIIYQDARDVVYNGQGIIIPNVNADFLIHTAHMNFEPLFVIFSELLYLFKLAPETNLDIFLEQTEKYKWQKTFLRTLNLLNNFHLFLYGELLYPKLDFKRLKFNKIIFPYVFSRKHIILSAFEKRLFVYALTRIFKTMRIALTRDAYRYIDSPERKAINQNSGEA